MKKLIIPCLAATAVFAYLSACTTVEERPASHTTTTTTENRSVRTPVEATSTTQTRSSY